MCAARMRGPVRALGGRRGYTEWLWMLLSGLSWIYRMAVDVLPWLSLNVLPWLSLNVLPWLSLNVLPL